MSREPIGARGGGYGLDAEVARKLASKYDPEVEAAVCSWISQIIGEPVEGSLLVALKNGQQLCKLINVVRPGSVRKIETSAIPFKQMENISNFLKACRVVGVPEHDLFETVDLYEGKDISTVICCLLSLARVTRSIPGFPVLAVGAASSLIDVTAGDYSASPTKVVTQPRPVGVTPTNRPPPPPSSGQSTNTTPLATSSAYTFVSSSGTPQSRPVASPAPSPAAATHATAHGAPLYGLDAELAQKMLDKHDPQRELEASNWIQAITRIPRGPGVSFSQYLRDGTVLCALLNAIRPGCVPSVSTSSLPYKQMENVSFFLRCCRNNMGVAEHDLFETVDLFDEKDISAVVRCIYALSRAVQKLNPPFNGPVLGL